MEEMKCFDAAEGSTTAAKGPLTSDFASNRKIKAYWRGKYREAFMASRGKVAMTNWNGRAPNLVPSYRPRKGA